MPRSRDLSDHSYDVIQSLGGMELEKDYPYTQKDGQCGFSKAKAKITLGDKAGDTPYKVLNPLARLSVTPSTGISNDTPLPDTPLHPTPPFPDVPLPSRCTPLPTMYPSPRWWASATRRR